ncbi:MAG: hypothetical protein Q4D73_02115 [Actinomycetaceae bacterium]|nr:hypothetical protein [Actinomycetaceae bacterium]
MTRSLPDLTPYFEIELPADVQQLTAAQTFGDLFIWQSAAEDERWDAPFDSATELLETDPEACFDQCMLALEAVSVEFPVIPKFLGALKQPAGLSRVSAVPLYCENFTARLLVTKFATFTPEIPFVKIPDIAVRGRLWLANQCSLGAFPHLQDPLKYAVRLASEAGAMAPGDPDSAAMLAIFMWMQDKPVKRQLEFLSEVFKTSFSTEQLSYAYYVAALLRSGTADALGCYQQVAPGTAFYEHALEEAVTLRAELELSQPDYQIPDYSDPAQVFNFMDGSTAVPFPVDAHFRQPLLELVDLIHSLLREAGQGEALKAFLEYDRLAHLPH